MKSLFLLFAFVASVAFATDEPRTIAESALAAWTARDGKALDAVSHPEFKAKCRHARVFESPVTEYDLRRKVVASGSDQELLVMFCSAISKLAPHPQASVYTYVKTETKGNIATVEFNEGWKRQNDGTVYATFKKIVVLEKDGDNWRYLWSPEASIYVDLNWDPTQ
jgi:hypothetical protein